MKRCRWCGWTKHLGEFHRDKTKPDGHRGICAACVNSRYNRVRKHAVIDWARDHAGIMRAVRVYDPEPDLIEPRSVP